MKLARPTRAIALLRVSSVRQAAEDREGLPVQREACLRIAAAHGLEIVEWVELPGVSGAAVLGDARFVALLRRLQSPDVHAVIVAAFDRLFRREKFSDYAILDAFAETGTHLYTADGEMDVTGESGGLLSVMRAELGGIERRAIIRRTKDARRKKRREKGVRAEGNVGMPRGVTFDHAAQTWSYVWPEAARVRQAFELLLGGVTNMREIHRQTGLGASSEPSSAVLRVLRQPLYKGVFRIDRAWDNKTPTQLPPEQVLEHQVLDPPLVSPEEWERAQAILARLSRQRPPIVDPEERGGAVYVGHVRCALCGGAVNTVKCSLKTPEGRRLYWSYVCGHKRRRKEGVRQPGGCALGQVSLATADPQLDAQVAELLGQREVLQGLIDRREESRAVGLARDYQRRIEGLLGQKPKLGDAYTAGAFDLVTLKKRLAMIDADVRMLEDLLAAEPDETAVTPEVVRDVAEAFAFWQALTRAEKREILRTWGVTLWVSVDGRRRDRRVRVEKFEIGVLSGEGSFVGSVAVFNPLPS